MTSPVLLVRSEFTPHLCCLATPQAQHQAPASSPHAVRTSPAGSFQSPEPRLRLINCLVILNRKTHGFWCPHSLGSPQMAIICSSWHRTPYMLHELKPGEQLETWSLQKKNIADVSKRWYSGSHSYMVAVHGCSAPHSNVFFHWSILFPKLLTHLNQIAPPRRSPLRCQLWWRHSSCSQKSAGLGVLYLHQLHTSRTPLPKLHREIWISKKR